MIATTPRRLAALALVLSAACSAPAPEADSAPVAAAPADSVAPSFVNRVWTVAESEQVAAGDTRVFLEGGTLVMTSPNATPAFGAWRVEDGQLIITEEGIDYRVDVLELTADRFRIRINSPGEPVTILFRPADQPPSGLRMTGAG